MIERDANILFMLFNTFLFLASAMIAYWGRHYYETLKKKLNRGNVIRSLQKIGRSFPIPAHYNENDVEAHLAHHLSRYFSPVNRQYQIKGNLPKSKEKVDIDIGEGRIGIEIKMARLIRKSNERNRFLGQLELYQERLYRAQDLIAVLVGVNQDKQDPRILEIQKILNNKGVVVLYLESENNNE